MFPKYYDLLMDTSNQMVIISDASSTMLKQDIAILNIANTLDINKQLVLRLINITMTVGKIV